MHLIRLFITQRAIEAIQLFGRSLIETIPDREFIRVCLLEPRD